MLLSCISCLYILEIKPLPVISLANIFFKSVSCLFANGFLYVKKLLHLVRSHLFIFAFVFFVLLLD